MHATEHRLKDGRLLLIRQVGVDDAPAVLEHVHVVSGESDFLTFGTDEFEFTEAEERAFIADAQKSENRLFILGKLDDSVVALLTFGGGRRRRIRHAGEFGLSVRRACWGLGIGALMVDALVGWARGTKVVTKINLRVRTDNYRAIALYERKGFVREGTISRELLIDGTYFDNHVMGLTL